MLLALTDDLFVEDTVLGIHLRQGLLNDLESLGEIVIQARGVVHHISDLLPVIILILSFDNRNRSLEVISLGPELAIQSEVFGQLVFEPLGRVERVAIP